MAKFKGKIMKKFLFVLILIALAGSGCSTKRTQLFNGKNMHEWLFYLEDKSIDPADVWSIEDRVVRSGLWSSKDKVIHCKGTPNGYIMSRGWFSDYKLHLEWRWVEEPGNSGVLLHKTGPDKLWPRSIECQLQVGDAGDFWLIDGTGLVANGEVLGSEAGKFVNVKKKRPSNEKAPGQWNRYDIHCKGGTVKCYVNGLLQNEGAGATDTSGRICLQSEGAPIEFRKIYVDPF